MLLSMATLFTAEVSSSSPSPSSSSSSPSSDFRVPRLRKEQVKALKEEPYIADIEDLTLRFAEEEEGSPIRSGLLKWYNVHQRDLPWRKIHRNVGSEEDTKHENEDNVKKKQQKRAYATWVSEVMLQQTRVATVVEYFNRWMSTWPTIKDLSLASQEVSLVPTTYLSYLLILVALEMFSR